ncbi:hypothetical protein KFL_002060185 [Klebsormidium nitens]|uniref:Uncharacterized protein n=1 Tax=Klebsormidium nitens TaxID=105231 RepID=A0A1Y1I9P0_KLENI|nr:hypothetical protein KFL_002060185 [Klebsormidium nitens]|eukprot:GAQ84798.1 hypothetical protein KFL_002060185 [Klebsormidium nitens]
MAPSTRRQLLACAAAAALGATFLLSLTAVGLRLTESCGGTAWPLTRPLALLVKAARACFCIQAETLRAVFYNPVALLFYGECLCLLHICFLLVVARGNDESRPRARAPTKASQLLAPILCARSSFLRFWPPCNIIASAQRNGLTVAKADVSLSTTTHFLIIAALGMRLLVVRAGLWALIPAAMLLPVIGVPVFWRLHMAIRGNKDEDMKIAFRTGETDFLIAVSVGWAWHVFASSLVASDPSAWAQFRAVLSMAEGTSVGPSEMVAQIYLLVLTGLTLGFAYCALLEVGPLEAFCVVAWAFVLGPAPAVALHLTKLEKKGGGLEKTEHEV